MGGMGHHHAGHQGLEEVVNIPGIGTCFQHDLVGGPEVLLGPALELNQADPPGWQDHFLGAVDRSYHHIVFVQIKTYKTFRCIRHHCTPFRIGSAKLSGQGNVGLWANVRGTHRSELDLKVGLLM